jgi:Integrase zinc binding domain
MVMEVALVASQIEKIIREQAMDPECQQFAASAGADSLFDYKESCVLLRRSPVDGALQIFVPKSLQPKLLHLEHFLRTAGYPGVAQMFRTLQKRLFWKIMSTEVSETFVNSTHARGTGSRKAEVRYGTNSWFPITVGWTPTVKSPLIWLRKRG